MTRRLLVSYLAVTVVVLLLLEIPLAVFYSQRELERLTAGLERDATVIASIYEDDLEAGRPLDPAAAEAYTIRTGARVVVVDARGISQVDTEQPSQRDLSTRPEIATALTGVRSTGRRSSADARHGPALRRDPGRIRHDGPWGGAAHASTRHTSTATSGGSGSCWLRLPSSCWP